MLMNISLDQYVFKNRFGVNFDETCVDSNRGLDKSLSCNIKVIISWTENNQEELIMQNQKSDSVMSKIRFAQNLAARELEPQNIGDVGS